MTMTAEGSITRTELSLSPLTFGTSNIGSEGAGIYIAREGWGPGDQSQRRQTAQSLYTRGRVLVHAVQDVQTSILKLRVKGSSQADLYTRMNELTAAFSQFSYTLSININHKTWTYLCEMADYSFGNGGNVDDLMARSSTQYLTLTIPHSPVDTGSYGSAGTHPVVE